MIARLSSLVVWGLAAAAAVAWGLKFSARPTPVPDHASVAVAGGAPTGDLSRVLGQAPAAPVAEAPPPPNADGQVKLLGVVAPRPGHGGGLALVAVEGKPPRALRVGQALESGLVLQTVSHRRAEFARDGKAALVLELPELPPPQRGVPGGSAVAAPGGLAAVPTPAPPRPPAAVADQPVPPGGTPSQAPADAGQPEPQGTGGRT